MKIIYDIGANNGDDIPYYLLKADRVVAVEANPALCAVIASRFEAEIKSGVLVVENCVVTPDDNVNSKVPFYLHLRYHVLSQMLPPDPGQADQFKSLMLPAKPIAQIVETHGVPHYIKIDIERMDGPILAALFEHRIFPDYISAESHSIDVFCILVAQGGYRSFKLVDGKTVSTAYANHPIVSGRDGSVITYSFPHHSAGPYGEDVAGDWIHPDAFFRYLAVEGLGWKDIHASRRHPPEIAQMSSGEMMAIATARQQGRRLVLKSRKS